MTSTVEAETDVDPARGGFGMGAAACADGRTAELDSALSMLSSFVSEFEPARYSGEGASTLVSRFPRFERLAATGKSLAAARATQARQPEAGGHPTPSHWLSEGTGESPDRKST